MITVFFLNKFLSGSRPYKILQKYFNPKPAFTILPHEK